MRPIHKVVQSLHSGRTEVLQVPAPALTARSLLVETRASVISAGTERMLVEFGRAGLLTKARRHPDRVRQVVEKARSDGVIAAVEAVRSRLAEPVPMGYCNAGVVVAVGEAVQGFRAGDRVATNGGHAELVRVSPTLAAGIPDGVSFEAAAFAPLGAIGLHAVRLASLSLGETVVVYGLGLIGLLTVQIARANGCRVIGIDLEPDRLALARDLGADAITGGTPDELARAVEHRTGGVGADAVLLTLSTTSSEPLRAAARMSRKRGSLVLVGTAPVEFDRNDLYAKEVSFQVSCSYGPGRYDPLHEEAGHDYPLAYVRWTEGRNFAAVLGLMADGRLDVGCLIGRRLPLEEAATAYDLLAGDAPSLGIVLEYPARGPDEGRRAEASQRRPGLARADSCVAPPALEADSDPSPQPEPGHNHQSRTTVPAAGRGVVGFLGAGNFGSRVLMPAFARAGFTLHTVVSSGGTSAALAGRKHGFEHAAAEAEAVLGCPEIDTVVIATPHDTHADLVVAALDAGKDVFVEKPLALTRKGVKKVEAAMARCPDRVLCVGYNRRFAPMTRAVSLALEGRAEPLALVMTVNAGRIAPGHWLLERTRGGGTLVGEACHFIDLARHLVGVPATELRATPIGSDGHSAFLEMSFVDGSVASIQYIRGGPSQLPKERLEGVWGSRGFRIVNWRRMRAWWGGRATFPRAAMRPQKGHLELVEAFRAAVRREGEPPIPIDEVLEVGRLVVSLGGDAVEEA